MSSLGRRSFGELFTFSRASVANFVGPDGAIASAVDNRARTDYNPVTRAARGLLLEEARTNLFLNSAAPVTQSVTVTAQAYTLSFYGTGQIVLSGVASATLTGATNGDRAVLTFTPSAGSLVLTVSGSVQSVQLEAGAYATSFITTAGTATTRARDVCSVVAVDPWLEDAGGTLLLEVALGYVPPSDGVLRRVFQLDDGTESNRLAVYLSGTAAHVDVKAAGVLQADLTLGAVTGAAARRIAVAWGADDCAAVSTGAALATDATVTLPAPFTVARLGSAVAAGSELSAAFRTLRYWPRRLSNPELRSLVA